MFCKAIVENKSSVLTPKAAQVGSGRCELGSRNFGEPSSLALCFIANKKADLLDRFV